MSTMGTPRCASAASIPVFTALIAAVTSCRRAGSGNMLCTAGLCSVAVVGTFVTSSSTGPPARTVSTAWATLATMPSIMAVSAAPLKVPL